MYSVLSIFKNSHMDTDTDTLRCGQTKRNIFFHYLILVFRFMVLSCVNDDHLDVFFPPFFRCPRKRKNSVSLNLIPTCVLFLFCHCFAELQFFGIFLHFFFIWTQFYSHRIIKLPILLSTSVINEMKMAQWNRLKRRKKKHPKSIFYDSALQK